jgi:hypothetical protein
MKTNRKINPNTLKTRDYNALALILGATKSGVHVDQKKKRNLRACRGRVQQEAHE